jgi:HEAT repeat protein
MRVFTCLGLLSLITLAALHSAEPERTKDPDLSYEEKVLKDVGIRTDGPSLVAYFKSKALSKEDHERLTATVQLLGDDSFETREKASKDMTAFGRLAIRYLKEALKSNDRETVRRAERCLEEIGQTPYTAPMIAAARFVAVRRPEGATEAMLLCLPWIDEPSVEEAILEALFKTGLKDGAAEEMVIAAADDKEAARRAAAAFLLGQGTAENRKRAISLLKDTDARVRFRAATNLVRAGERDAVPALIALLTEGTDSHVWQVEEILFRLLGDGNQSVSPPAGYDEESRRKARTAWETWWKEKGAKVDLARLKQEDAYLGLTLLIELDGGKNGTGRIWECGKDGKPRWRIDTATGPIDAQVLPGGRVLVAEHNGQSVTERDQEGKEIWRHKCENSPVSCQRLANGNTVIATYNEILEVTRDHKVVFSQKRQQMIFNAYKLNNGNYLFVQANNQIIEMDEKGKDVSTVTVNGTNGWASAERLPNGNYIVALYNNGKVVEVNAAGKIVWEVAAQNPAYATRLRNGNTLVASTEGKYVAEFTPEKKELWKQTTEGRPFHVHRR